MNDKQEKIEILDTTLRDGAQGEGISFSVQDKIAVARALDELGVQWIEAGNPGSNPKDLEFFALAANLKLENAKLAAFGSTRKKNVKPAEDVQLQSLLFAETPVVVVFGKSWDLHVTEILRASLEENLDMISETIAFLKEKGRIVIYDAEHFFDGFVANREYALSTLKAAFSVGADRIALCDTNGGSFPDAITAGVTAGLEYLAPLSQTTSVETPLLQETAIKTFCCMDKLGIHVHNDCGMATANTIAAVKAGCSHVQGTLLGFGERCGNAALAEIIPNIELKMGLRCIPHGKLTTLYGTARKIAEITNIAVPDAMPYIGISAFSHKAGMHADGILKTRCSFEHIEPSAVGNGRRFLMSEVGGRAAIAERARKFAPDITKDNQVIVSLAAKLKKLEAEGWQFEGADASFEKIVRQELGKYQSLFAIAAYRVVSEHPTPDAAAYCHAWAKVLVDGRYEIAAAEGDGPVNALDTALRRALKRFYPELEQVRLTDYKVRVIDGKDATAAKVRVLIESTDGVNLWTTVGVSTDIIDASRSALVDSIEYKLIMDIERRFKVYL
ncbi:MAG: citramalate synthase [Treponema sp.]|jgi:2-isopropylmalate synthase|nr:citramalate synthase [Treponema sp.]